MAIVSNTFTKYDVVGLREDLADLIYNISPETTPFISNMTKRRQVTNTSSSGKQTRLPAQASTRSSTATTYRASPP